jgi:HEAT repeat protein
MKLVSLAIFRGRGPVFWLGVGLFATMAVVVATSWWPDEWIDSGPTYEDRTASDWLTEAGAMQEENPFNPPGYFLKGVNFEDGEGSDAVKAFRAMGRDGILFLARTLKMPVREKICRNIFYKHEPPEWLGEALYKVLHLSKETDLPRERAAWVLAQLGPAVEPALPEMLRIFRRGDDYDPVTHQIDYAFRGMGDKMAFMVPDLSQGLKDTNSEHAVTCAEILGAIGPKAKAGLPALLNATNAGGELTQAAAFAIWDIDRETNVVVEVLARILKYPAAIVPSRAAQTDRSLRWSALKSLWRRGTDLRAVAPIVQQALYDSNSSVRDEAEKALQVIDPERLQATIDQLNRNAPLILQQIIASLQNGTNEIPSRAFTVIKFFGPKAESAVPALIEALNQKPLALPSHFGLSMRDQSIFQLLHRASTAIGAIGPMARDAVPALTNLLGRRENDAETYCEALGRMGPDAGKAIPVLEALFNATNGGIYSRRYPPGTGIIDAVRFAAARALVEITPTQASNTVNFLKKAEEERGRPEWNRYPMMSPFSAQVALWNSAQVALWKGGLEKNPPVTNLMAILSSKTVYSDSKLTAIQLLEEIGPEARPALPLLETFLKCGEPDRWDAAIAIQRIDPQEAARLGLPGLLLAY